MRLIYILQHELLMQAKFGLRGALQARSKSLARRDCQPNSKKLTQLEEEVIVKYILDLDLRGFAPTYAAVRDMADKLLAARGAG